MNPEDIEFPQSVTIRIICEDRPEVLPALFTHAEEKGFGRPKEGNHSANGRYLTWLVDATFADLQTMRSSYEALKEVDGVRMVL